MILFAQSDLISIEINFSTRHKYLHIYVYSLTNKNITKLKVLSICVSVKKISESQIFKRFTSRIKVSDEKIRLRTKINDHK